MSAPRPPRISDRWLTPGVVVALVFTAGVVVLGVLAAVTYLTARGFDPAPVVQLAGTLVAATGAMGTFVQGLVNRKTTTKVERNSGQLGVAALRAVDLLEAERGRHASPVYPDRDKRGTAPASPGSADLDQDASSTGTPGRGPSYSSERYRDTPSSDLQDTAWFRQ